MRRTNTELNHFKPALNVSATLATDIGDTVNRFDGTEVPLVTPWLGDSAAPAVAETPAPEPTPAPVADAPAPEAGTRPAALEAARDGKADDLTLIKGVGPKLAAL